MATGDGGEKASQKRMGEEGKNKRSWREMLRWGDPEVVTRLLTGIQGGILWKGRLARHRREWLLNHLLAGDEYLAKQHLIRSIGDLTTSHKVEWGQQPIRRPPKNLQTSTSSRMKSDKTVKGKTSHTIEELNGQRNPYKIREERGFQLKKWKKLDGKDKYFKDNDRSSDRKKKKTHSALR